MKNFSNLSTGKFLKINRMLDNCSALIDVILEDGTVKEYVTDYRRIPLAKAKDSFSFYEAKGTINYNQSMDRCEIEPKISAMGIISSYEINQYLLNN